MARTRSVVRLVASIAFAGSMCVSASAAVIYVKATAAGANNGSTWTDAFNDLQLAIATANANDEIWVAGNSTYKPTSGTARSAASLPKAGVAMYGGFAGTKPLRTQRDWNARVTVLSGAIGTAAASDNS